MVSSSTGGKACWKTPMGPAVMKSVTSAATRTSGPSASAQRGSARRGGGGGTGSARRAAGGSRSAGSDTRRLLDVEDSGPPELGELALVRVEHERTGVLVGELEHRPLSLSKGDRVGEFVAVEIRSGPIEPEEVPVEVERVQQVELGDVHEIDAGELAGLHRNRKLLVVEGDGVDRVDLVLVVEIGVECVHHHHHLIGRRAALLRVDDEYAVETLVDVPLDRHGVAVIELEPGGLGVELVREGSAGRHHLEGAVHVRRVDSV